MSTNYLHGYDKDEQAKLDRNAEYSYDVTKNFLKIQDTSKFKMIEIGCGTGYTLNRLAKDYPHAHFTGIDIGEKHIDCAKHRCKDLKNCSFFKADILKDDISDRYDVALMKYVMIHLTNHIEVLRRIRKLLKSGGRVSIFDNCWSSLNIFPESQYFTQYAKDSSRYWIETGKDPDIGAKLSHLLHNAGYNNIRVEEVSAFASADMDYDNFTWRCERLTEGIYEDFYSLLGENKDSFIHNIYT